MNQPTIDNDLQKAIDDITKNTNSDPIFADPVAAPDPTPIQAQTFEPTPAPTPNRAINNFPRSAMVNPSPMPAPITPMPQPSLNRPAAGPIVEPLPSFNNSYSPTPIPTPVQPQMAPEPAVSAPLPTPPEPIAPNPSPSMPLMSEMNFTEPETVPSATFVSETVEVSEPEVQSPETFDSLSEMSEIKRAALRDLSKVIDKLDVSPTQKFDVYKKVHDNFGDETVIAPAYKAATEIPDEKERGEALLYLVNSIDD